MMDVVEYYQKMNSLLTDSKTYKKLTKEPTPSLERMMNEMLLQLKKSGSITSSLYDKLRCSAGHLPLLYGLPKVHKPEVPLCPIVSFLRSPTYQLSKHLTTILSALLGNSPSHVRNSTAFTEFIKPQVLSSDKLLVSFNVVSLFTNIPVHLATEVAQRRLEDDVDLKDRTGLNVKEVMMLLELCLSATLLYCRGGVYQQIFGTAMGSPVSVTIPNLVIEDVKERALATTDVPLRIWKRYVDDTA